MFARLHLKRQKLDVAAPVIPRSKKLAIGGL
jgi:hypothetical protein